MIERRFGVRQLVAAFARSAAKAIHSNKPALEKRRQVSGTPN